MPRTNQGSYTQCDLASTMLSRAYDIILAWPDPEKAHQIQRELASGDQAKNQNNEKLADDKPSRVEP